MDYRRNNKTFYTQGVNFKKGCIPCSCHFCSFFCCCSCPSKILNLRENIEPNNPDFNVGRKKGITYAAGCCLGDKSVIYLTQDGERGPRIKASCCQGCCCCDCNDYTIDIEDGNGGKFGNIIVPNGCNSVKVKDMCCYLPRKYYEINITANITSEQKFQIIADIIHFALNNL